MRERSRLLPAVHIDERDLQFHFLRAAGPGGQNVNKVSTAVELRFDVHAAALPADTKERLLAMSTANITRRGTLIIVARRFRTQEANRKDAVRRLEALIERASRKPTARTATRPTRASQDQRLRSKKRKSQIKRARSLAAYED